ncbi:MAG: pyruvate formate-lyase-activating protein, partial [Victivallales bacterium]|nr:pyruvate formate-lyase-activating protein [Victivallales bacterium]
MNNPTGRIHSLESFGAVDGPGIRYVVFFQGCPLRCLFCHNPDTWAFGEGTEMGVEELVAKIVDYRPFYRDGGVTLTGGEPLAQPEFAAALLRRLKEEGFHTAVDTAGSIPLDRCREAVDLADLLLLDIKALDDALCRDLTGHSNRNTLATLDYCEEHGKSVWIRHVMVPGLTLTRDRLTALAAYLKPFKCIQRIDLLPFHKMAEYKWEQLHIRNTLLDTPEPTKEEIRMAEEIFFPEKFGKS